MYIARYGEIRVNNKLLFGNFPLKRDLLKGNRRGFDGRAPLLI